MSDQEIQFVCDRCKTKYNIDRARVRGKSVKVRCRPCGNILEIRDPGLRPGPKPSVSPAASPSAGGRVAVPIGSTSPVSAKPPSQVPPATGPTPSTASPQVAPGATALGERFQQAFVAREVAPATGSSVPAPATDEADELTHIVATPLLGDAAKTTPSQEALRKLARWHVSIRNQPMGPMSEEAIRRHIESGEVDVNSLVWREGFDEWRSLGQVRELAYLAELAAKAGGREGPAGSRESVLELPPIRQVEIVQATPISPLQRWLTHAVVAVTFFGFGMLVMYLVVGAGETAPSDGEPASAGLPVIEEVATAEKALPTLQLGAFSIQLANPTVVRDEPANPGATGAKGTGSKNTEARRSGGRSPGGTNGHADGSGAGSEIPGSFPSRETGPVGGSIQGGNPTPAPNEAPPARPLSARQIEAVVRAGQAGISLCYNQARVRDFIGSVSVRVTIEVSPDGSVQKATLASNDHLTPEFESCLLNRIRQWRFPRTTATSRLVLPLAFHGR